MEATRRMEFPMNRTATSNTVTSNMTTSSTATSHTKETFVARIGDAEWTFEVAANGSGGATGDAYRVRRRPEATATGAAPGDPGAHPNAPQREVTWTPLPGGRVLVRIDARPVVVQVRPEPDAFLVEGASHRLRVPVTDEIRARAERSRAAHQAQHRGPKGVLAPMPGTLLQVLVAEGQDVEEGQPLFVIEAMKMQNEVASPLAGRIRNLRAAAGQAVEARQLLVEVVPPESE